MKKLIIAVTLVLFSSASVASAAIIQYFDTFGPTGVTAAGYNVALNQFDSSLGTLNSVTLLLSANTDSGTLNWDNESGVITDVTLEVGATVTAAGPGALTSVATPFQQGSQAGVAADNDAAPDFIGTDSFSISGGSGTDSDSNALFAGLAPYIGLGTFDTFISSVLYTSVGTTGGGFGATSSVNGLFDGTLTVTYDYTSPVPEPATMLLFGIGLAGLGFIQRKKRMTPSGTFA